MFRFNWAINTWAGSDNPLNVLKKSVNDQTQNWKSFISRMSARTGRTSARLDIGNTGQANATISLVNRGFDTWADTAIKAVFFIWQYPLESADEARRMVMGQPHGAEGGTNKQIEAMFNPHFNKVGNYPAGTSFMNSIYERTMRGDGREALYPDRGLIPDYGPPTQLEPISSTVIIVALSLGAAVTIFLALIDVQKHAITMDATIEAAKAGIDLNTSGSRTEYGFDLTNLDFTVRHEGGGTSSRRNQTPETITSTTSQNQNSGAGVATIVQPMRPIVNIQTPTQTQQTQEPNAAIPLGLGALAYFLL